LRIVWQNLEQAGASSINNFIVSAVAEKIAVRRAIGWLKQQAGANGSPERLFAILAEAPDASPMLWDELPPTQSRRRK